MQRRHDDFEGGLVLEFRMRVDRNAAAVVGHGNEAVGFEFDLDEVGVAFQRLVHRVVDDFGEDVMHRLFVGAADIHAGPTPHRLKPLQHLDVAGGIGALGARGTCGAGRLAACGRATCRRVEQVTGGGFFCCFCHTEFQPRNESIGQLCHGGGSLVIPR